MWQKQNLPIRSNSFFCHNLFNSRLLQMRQNVSTSEKGLTEFRNEYFDCLWAMEAFKFDLCGDILCDMPSPGSSVGIDACFQSRVCEFEIQLGQRYFQHLTKNHCDNRHSSFINELTVYVEKQPVTWKVCCVEYW